MTNTEPRPFSINVDQEILDWVTDRVRTSRIIPDAVQLPENKLWADGTPSSVMRDLVEYWKNDYDWRKVEAKLNSRYKMFMIDIEEAGEDIQLHFVHHRSDRKDAIPLLFPHGWPGNFTEVGDLLSLTAPEDPKQQAFHIVAPTIPGYVFSSPPKSPDFNITNIGEVYHKLMVQLGYPKYVGQGGDWGSMILRSMAQKRPESLVAVHLNLVFAGVPSIWHPFVLMKLILRMFTEDEKKRLGRMQNYLTHEIGYATIQKTKPQSLSYGLLDSPVGMLAWIREKLNNWSEPDYVWDKEVVITWTMLYLLSNSAWHARLYKSSLPDLHPQLILNQSIPSTVAFGASLFPAEIAYVPRWWAQGSVADNIVFWKEKQKGGHFASVEVPDALKKDLLEFVNLLPKATKVSLREQVN
ncbi:epoxide hydrolase domain-containing protein [Crepidotus variabilis]|uniref:Epoxide hydrolase domain-containing protein n=1 Tax=Crepidotus variabilis TaxID=179855 RepID=A0A9P6EIA3_9AGAR|nr:epoxide hydrolase domain-containing protein [Crepidotus variabilis]